MDMFNTVDEEFLLKNLKDSSFADQFIKNGRRRATIAKFMIGAFLVLILVAIVYSIVETANYNQTQAEISEVQAQIAARKEEAMKQLSLASEAQEKAVEENEDLKEKLKDCGKK
jgi:cell division protein FtsL